VIQFTSDQKPLTFLLDQVDNRDLALPDFQRSFVWDPGATRELVASIVRSFPAGTLLLMQGGAQVFAPRAVEEAPALNGQPSFLILDGQQRMTSLYQAFSGTGTHRYFLNLQELIDGFDVDDAQPAGAAGSQIVGDYALPVSRDLLNVPLLRRPHHDYPAWDLAVPIGTPVYATHRGTVIAVTDDERCGRGLVIAGLDGGRYTYCHADAVTVARGQVVAAGSQIMRSGNTGRSTGPHLHLQIHSPAGSLVCPQDLMESWYAGRAAGPSTAPTTGCTS